MSNEQLRSGRSIIGSAVAWIRRLKASSKELGELRSLDGDALLRISRDLNLSVADLEVLSSGDGRSGERLLYQLKAFGLSTDVVQLKFPEVMRDLQRVCGNCSSVQTCDDARATSAALMPKLTCPNEDTLEALQKTSKASMSAVAPVWPHCC